jgi:eukaryotic-like serine/threonine-protein kinase
MGMTIEAIHSTATDPRVGRVLNERYQIERLIGRGGMSTIYAATDTALGRTVALKIFGSDGAARGDFDRQSAEIGVLAGLSHPGLVTLYDAFESSDGDGVIVLEFVDGPDLRRRLRQGPLEPAAIRLMARALADALAYVHSHGIVHRDVTPANILLPGGRMTGSMPVAKLTDFGIARIVESTRQTSEGSVLGTANYLSPEQAVGATVGPASDIYSLGLVLLEAHTGEHAFPGTGIEALAARLHRDPEIPPTISPAWRALISACVSREPADRPTAVDLVHRIRRLTRRSQQPSPPAIDPDSTVLWSRDEIAAESRTIEQALTATPVVVTSESRRVRRHEIDDDYRGAPAMGRRRLLASVVVGLVVAALTVGIPIIQQAMPPAEVETVEPDYPAVEGTLGAHLELLQRLVAR